MLPTSQRPAHQVRCVLLSVKTPRPRYGKFPEERPRNRSGRWPTGICQTPHFPFAPDVLVLWLILIPVFLIAGLFWLLRRNVCVRQRDCCGKGCGCLFPVRKKNR